MTQKQSDTSMELQPCEATIRTDSPGYLDHSSQPSVPSRSSRMYAYAYEHMIDRFVALLHLRHRQELYSIRNQHSNTRPSSMPPTQAPSPLGHTLPSCPLILPFPANEESLQCPSTCDEYLEPKAQIHVTPLLQSSLYEEIFDSDRKNQYDEIT